MISHKKIEFVLNNSKENLGVDKMLVSGGKNEYLLSSGECSMARLQPDYLLEMSNGRKDIVTDAKWKLLEATENENKGCATVNISSGDVYQIFSYLHFYNAQNTAYLFVPKISNNKKMIFSYKDKNSSLLHKKIKIMPIDLEILVQNRNILNKEYLKKVRNANKR